MAESAAILKEEYKKLRQDKSGSGSSYRFTVRQLESLIRLSEAMARLHCDDKIRPAYVTEVCRLLKASNINIVKDDIELEENQNALNQVATERA
jgi:DNA replication licensing factor MCM6